MLKQGSRRPRNGEQGQTLILALVFIVFFAVVASAVLRFGDVTGLQQVHTEATAATDSVAEGGAAYAAADAASSVIPTCTSGNTGQLTMVNPAGTPGDKVGYTINRCNPSGSLSTGGAGVNCLLCILNQASPTTSVLYAHCAAGCGTNPALTTYGGNDYINGNVTSGTSLTSYSCTTAPCSTHAQIDVLYGSSSSGCICAPTATPYAPAITDPLAGLLPPSSVAGKPKACTPAPCTPTPCPPASWNATTGCTMSINSSTAEIGPGLWASLSIDGNPSTSVTVDQGTYVFTGPLSVAGNATVTGTSGVTLYLACPNYGPSGLSCPTAGATGASVALGGNGSIKISSPSSGQYAGVAVLADPHLRDPGGASSCASSGTNCVYRIPGNAVSVSGTVDTRSGGISITGNGGDIVSLGRLVTNSFYMTVSGSAGSGLTLTGPAGAISSTTCGVFEDGVYGAAIAPLSPPSAVIQSACGSGTTSGIVDFNYLP